MQEDGERCGVSGQDDDFRSAAVEGLGCFVGSLLQLPVVAGLLDEVEDGLRQSLIREGPCWISLSICIYRDTVGDLPALDWSVMVIDLSGSRRVHCLCLGQ